MIEEWKAVRDWPEYEVSSLGRIRRDGKCLRGSFCHGHIRVKLSRGPLRIRKFLHVLVLEAFIGPAPTADHEAAHWDGVPTNNKIKNLRWVTPKENQADSMRHGTKPKGELQGRAKLTNSQVREIRRLLPLRPQRQIAKLFGVTPGAINHIVKGRQWRSVQ